MSLSKLLGPGPANKELAISSLCSLSLYLPNKRHPPPPPSSLSLYLERVLAVIIASPQNRMVSRERSAGPGSVCTQSCFLFGVLPLIHAAFGVGNSRSIYYAILRVTFISLPGVDFRFLGRRSAGNNNVFFTLSPAFFNR